MELWVGSGLLRQTMHGVRDRTGSIQKTTTKKDASLHYNQPPESGAEMRKDEGIRTPSKPDILESFFSRWMMIDGNGKKKGGERASLEIFKKPF